MNLVLTMAGKYQRFKLFGNKVPKYLMPLGKTTVLWHVLYEITRSNPKVNVYLLANESDRDFQPIIRAIMDDFSIGISNLAYIADTSSQLETAASIFDEFDGCLLSSKDPISFTNIDTILKSRRGFFDRLESIKPNEGLIDSFIGSSHEYSYIRPDSEGNVSGIADHSRISEHACSGLYSFGSGAFFCFQVKEFFKKSPTGNFTDLYHELIDQGFLILFNSNPDTRDTIVLGTPEEYILNIHRFR
jgi:hypothetical protein